MISEESTSQETAWDDVSGAELKPNLVKFARKEEIYQFEKHQVYQKVQEEECWKVMGKPLIGTKRIDIKRR